MDAIRMKWEGKEYLYDGSKIDMETAYVILAKTGWGLGTLDKQFRDIHPKAVHAICFAMKKQAGENVEFDACAVEYPVEFYTEYLKGLAPVLGATLDELAKGEVKPKGKARPAKGRSTKTRTSKN